MEIHLRGEKSPIRLTKYTCAVLHLEERVMEKEERKKIQCILRLQVVLFPLHVPLAWHLLTTDP